MNYQKIDSSNLEILNNTTPSFSVSNPVENHNTPVLNWNELHNCISDVFTAAKYEGSYFLKLDFYFYADA